MQTETLTDRVDEILPHLTSIRRRIHRQPELMYQERRTSRLVCDDLDELGVEYRAGLAETGVIAHIPATTTPQSATTIGLRADMDALPITEETGAEYASETPGVMHACGHDGHTAILLGAARLLNALDERPNNVTLVFQPAEEGGGGADRMCREGALDGANAGGLGRPVELMYGLHGWPELPVGTVATRVGPILAATDEWTIDIIGRGGHAAYPHLCSDPVVAASAVVTALQTIASRRVSPLDSVICTVGAINGGFAHNVIPDRVRLIGTVRTLRDETRATAEADFRRIVESVAHAHDAVAEIHWKRGYPVTANDEAATRRMQRIAREALGEANVITREHPTMGGEDFSYYSLRVPACFFFLGLRRDAATPFPNLHTPTFDFNDDAIPVGVEVMARLALDRL